MIKAFSCSLQKPSAWSTRCQRRSTLHAATVRADADFCELPMYREVPDMDKRRTLNKLVLGAVALPATSMAWAYLSALIPAR